MSDENEEVSEQTTESVENPGVSWEWEVEQNRLKGIEPLPDLENDGEQSASQDQQGGTVPTDNHPPFSFIPANNSESVNDISDTSDISGKTNETEEPEVVTNDSEEDQKNNDK